MQTDKQNKKDKDEIAVEGVVTKILNGSMYQVRLENGLEVHGFLSGKMRQNNIKITLGDGVEMVMSPYDLTKGRITYRKRG